MKYAIYGFAASMRSFLFRNVQFVNAADVAIPHLPGSTPARRSRIQPQERDGCD